ncbi:hypothetical protein K525DRAFT_254887 [Schizophyllum commune Loenen D]|nr:hypothetical protein K525DRAFT_254887 [Schizophyllum commune Loenen D]
MAAPAPLYVPPFFDTGALILEYEHGLQRLAIGRGQLEALQGGPNAILSYLAQKSHTHQPRGLEGAFRLQPLGPLEWIPVDPAACRELLRYMHKVRVV